MRLGTDSVLGLGAPARHGLRALFTGACLVSVAAANALDHAPLDALLKRHVRAGRVDYAALAKRVAVLDQYLEGVAAQDASVLPGNAALAFYLNAYNALVLRQVLARWPAVKRVVDEPGFFDKQTHRVAGRTLTLNALENDVIRPRFREPRIHFALVCAARSCPPLQRRAFVARTVKRVLARLARGFIRSRHGLRKEGEGFVASKLFEWYRKDFEDHAGSLAEYLARAAPQHAQALRAGAAITFGEYDWRLNARRR